ncbi:MAG: ribbon-helix-helix domain-containing protein [Vicinamibacteria bacterium]
MKPIQVELPDRLAEELRLLVKAGWFRNEEEAVRVALLEFVRRHRVELLERFQREDIAWALRQKKASSS